MLKGIREDESAAPSKPQRRNSCSPLEGSGNRTISSAPAEGLLWALPIGDGGTKGGATCRFKSETPMLAEWLPQPFPSRSDREFESVFLQQRVTKTAMRQ